MADNDQPELNHETASPPAGEGSERTCVLSGRKASRDDLIRLALAPDGTVAPDVRARAPGRGAWIGVDRAALEEAIAKGRLAKALNRAFKTAVTVPADLADQIERALERAALDRLGLEARAGQLVTGAEKIADAARKGTVELLLHARDAAADGTRRLDQALRTGLGVEGSDLRGLAIPATRAILSMALGRENVVHLALIAPAAAARVNQALGRWRGFIGLDDGP
ncbi:RNA-binding protein [Sphingomonas sp.]|uniref:RNA-binding protein n=1 Tax=Sphingomonas sp. TaxID=28214 RepID=UPI003B3AFEA8